MACGKYGMKGNPEWDAVKDVIMADTMRKDATDIAAKMSWNVRDVERVLGEINRENPLAVNTFKEHFGLVF